MSDNGGAFHLIGILDPGGEMEGDLYMRRLRSREHFIQVGGGR